MLYLLSANSPKLLDVSLIAMGVLAIIVCLLSFVAFALFCVLAVKKDTSGNKGTKHQAIFPIFVLTLSPLIPIGVSAVLLIELALLVWAVVWLAKELKKPSAPEAFLRQPVAIPMFAPCPT